MRMNWPRVAKKRENVRNFDEMLTLDEIFKSQQANPDHLLFKDFLKFMLVLDPNHRPSANDCLKHPFLREDYIIADD